MTRSEWCACGGIIVVGVPATDDEIFRAVRTHNQTVRHQVWRQDGGMDARPRGLDGYERRAA